MSNSHGIPDTLKELQATDGDLLAPCILSTTWPTVPASSLTLAAFATYGYARSGRDLVYIDQPAVTVTLPSAAATYWLGLHRDTSSAVSGWTRRDGSHYVFQASASQPTPPDGVVLLSSVTVAGSIITAVSQTGILRAPMSRQDASAVAITGGSLSTMTTVQSNQLVALEHAGNDQAGFVGSLAASGGTNRWNVFAQGTAPNYFLGQVGIGPGSVALATNVRLQLHFGKDLYHGLKCRQIVNDTGPGQPIIFANSGDTQVGSISTTVSATAYNTSSDVRLKHAVQTLAGALERVQALRPVSFRWQVDDSPGIGFLAHELMTVVPEAVTGLPDAVNEDGSVKPQGVDHSRLVPWLTAGLQAALEQIDVLTARVATLEEALGA